MTSLEEAIAYEQRHTIFLNVFAEAAQAVEAARAIYSSSVTGIRQAVLQIVERLYEQQFADPARQGRWTDEAALREALLDDLISPLALKALDWTYPIILLRPYYYVNAEAGSYDYMRRSPNFYGGTVTKVTCDHIRERLCHELERVQRGIGSGFYPYLPEERPKGRPLIPIYVGKSKTPIPVTFALRDGEIKDLIRTVYLGRRYGLKESDALNKVEPALEAEVKAFGESAINFIQDVLPLPSLVEIDERTVDLSGRHTEIDERRFRVLPSESASTVLRVYDPNAEFKFALEKKFDDAATDSKLSGETLEFAKWDVRRFEKITTKDLRPLTFYEALRVDYSCGRLEHYCHTPYHEFQPFGLLTNYKKYVEAFLRLIVEQYVKEGDGYLCVPSFDLDEGTLLSLSPKLQDWLEKGKGKGHTINSTWVKAHIDFANGNGAGANRAQGPIDKLSLSQWTGFWANNFSAQMPAYHYVPRLSLAEAELAGLIPALEAKRPSRKQDGSYLPGITLVNIGVGPSNAKNLTDNMAVLRPIAWLMLGHCGGLRTTLKVGDFVLAQAYVREDGILDQELPHYVPIPEIFEITEAIKEAAYDILLDKPRQKARRSLLRELISLARGSREAAVSEEELVEEVDERLPIGREAVTKEEWEKVRKRLRVGTVVTTADRNWELDPLDQTIERFDKSRAVAIDMESATIAANGFRHRVFYGALLCVSDRPLFGTIKMRGMASAFYEESTAMHLKIGIEAVKRMMTQRYRLAASRKISGFDDPIVGSW